jgi:hypothetical protein
VRSKKAYPLSKEESKRGIASLKKSIPLPLVKGKGIQGIGSPYTDQGG